MLKEYNPYFITARKESGLHDWFEKSSSGGKKGWVQIGGKYDGKPCARQQGQKTTPKCTSSAKRASMTKEERDDAARRKRRADPDQPNKRNAAKPTYVSTDRKSSPNRTPKKKDKDIHFKSGYDLYSDKNPNDSIPIKYKTVQDVRNTVKKLENYRKSGKYTHARIVQVANVMTQRLRVINSSDERYSVASAYFNKLKKITKDKSKKMSPARNRDKKGKGSGQKDACYYKVKSRYRVWPSAYASGALVKCRNRGASNWGNS